MNKFLYSTDPLIVSNGGLHLSAYIHLKDLPQDMEFLMNEVKPLLSDKESEFVEEFLAPIRDRLKRWKIDPIAGTSLSIFRKAGFLQISKMNYYVKKPIIVLANSFHIKPLLESHKDASQGERQNEDLLNDGPGFLLRKNLFEIARAATEGRVHKLVFRKDYDLFGEFDRSSGGVTLNLKQTNHLDDCLIDDIAQTVLAKGGEVVAASKNELPGRSPMAALIRRKNLVEEEQWSNFPKIS